MKNNIICVIITLFISFNQSVFSEYSVGDSWASRPDVTSSVYDAYPYFSVGVGPVVIIPNLGMGYRERYSQLGWDTALSFSTIGYAHQVSAHLVGHYYFSPMRQDSFYTGLGVLGSGIFTNRHGACATLSPDIVFGKELERKENSRHFVEMHIAAPTLTSARSSRAVYLPLMYVRYGISF